ncbi:Glycosyl transferase [Vibrio chagasii]|nr:Glycosyl transferase [Vibrio chagasii]
MLHSAYLLFIWGCMDISISVVIPLYNKDYCITNTLKSVVEQSKKVNEIIVIDDGSTDNSFEVAHEYLTNNSKGIHWELLKKENGGVSSARNKGLELASNNYIAFLDADDIWYQQFVSDRVEAIINEPRCIVYSGSHYLNGEFKSPYVTKYKGVVDCFYLRSIKASVVNSSKSIFCKESLISVGGFPEGATVAEDLYVWILLAEKGDFFFDSKPNVEILFVADNSRKKRLGNIPYPIEKLYKNDLSIPLRLYLKTMLMKHYVSAVRNNDIDFLNKTKPLLSKFDKVIFKLVDIILR